MNIAFTTYQNASLSIPIQFLFWGFVAVYAIHILEESVLGESFVDGEILFSDFFVASVIGALITALMFGGLVITKAKTMGHSSAR